MPRCVQACCGGHPPARGPRDHAGPHQERLAHLLDGGGFFADGDRQRGHPDRSATEAAGQRGQHRPVEPVQAQFVDVVDRQGGLGDIPGDDAVGAHLGVVTDPAQQPVGDARGAARASRDLRAGIRGELDAEDARRAGQHPFQLGGLVEVHVRGEAEPVPQRPGQRARPGGRAHQRERRHLQRNRRGARTFADDDVDAEVLHRQVQHLLGGPGDAVDLVDEQHVVLRPGWTAWRPDPRPAAARDPTSPAATYRVRRR